MKIEITSFDVAALIHELNQTVINARIENIYQTSPKMLLLRLHKPNHPTMQLLIEAGKRFHVTSYVQEKPAKPPAFCMALRKHLKGGIIQDIEQHEFERTVTFKIRARQDTVQLIVELFGDGNIILTNSQGVIVTALAYKRMRDRDVLRNEPFQHAPESGRNPFNLTLAHLDALKDFGQLEAVRGLTRLLSVGGSYAEEVLGRAGVDKNTPCEQLTPQKMEAIFKGLQAIMSALRKGEFEPAIIISEKGDWVDATPIRLRRYQGLATRDFSSFSKALDEYFAQTSHVALISEAEKQCERELAKQQRMLREQQRTLEDARKAAEQNKRIGDVIHAHLGELQLLLKQVSDLKQSGESWEHIVQRLEKEKQSSISPAIYFDSLDSKNLTLSVSIDDLVFPIRMRRSAQANAAEHFEKMKKAERKAEGAENALKETQRRIKELKKGWMKKIEETRIKTPPKQLKKSWYEKFRWFISSDGFLVIGGKDAITNEILIKKHLMPHDMVFHASLVGAPFVILKTEGKPPTEQVIQEAAQFAASYSRAWREMLSAIEVYWVHPHQVSKTAPTGQYVQKGAFIIQGSKNYVRKVPLRVAIGWKKIGEQFRVIGGPTDAVRKQAEVYAEIVPGNEPSAKLAKQIKRMLSENVAEEDREKISRVSNEEIQQFIPFGKGTIVTSKD